MKKLIPSIIVLSLVAMFISQFGPGYVYAKKSDFYKEFRLIEKSNEQILKLGSGEVCGYISGQLNKMEDSISRNEIFFLSDLLFSNHFSGYYLGSGYSSYNNENGYYGLEGGGYLQEAAFAECVDCKLDSLERTSTRYVDAQLVDKVKAQFSNLSEQAGCGLEEEIQAAYESWVSYLD